MKKILNRPEDVVEEMINGLVATHEDIVHRVGDTRVVARNYEGKGKVGLVSGGGSGHEPSHAGFVGKGMLSTAVCGDVFTSPTVDQVYEGIKAADKGAGVFLVIKNYTGDVINFTMAKEMAEEMDNIKVDFVITNDDIAVEGSTWTEGRRGVAGTVLVHKILGALADNGASLEEIKAESEVLIAQMATLGLALTPAIVPQAGKPGFELGDDEIEFGLGIHGEPGYRRAKLQPSKVMAKEFIDKIVAELKLTAGEKVVAFVNGLGGTPLMEQYVFMNDVLNILGEHKIEVARKLIGNKMTSIEMQGISLTLLRVKDPRWVEYLDQEVKVAAW
jgi:phosphoenolpyruvate---glycerone phosphotransferase subunit DhaK